MLQLNEICNAFSVILDMAGERTFEHSKRTAYIATRLGETVGFPKHLCFYGGLLHDIGASGELNAYSLKEVHTQRHLIYDHAKLGAEIVKDLPFLGEISPLIKYHHEHYNGSGAFKLSGNEIPLGARILYLADQIDLQLGENLGESINREKIIGWVQEFSGKTVFPELKDAFLVLAATERFWLDLENRNLDYSLSKIQPQPLYISFEEFEVIAHAFSRIIDNKSKFTHNHSLGLFKVAQKLAAGLGYDGLMLKKIGIAAYLHDLGKLIVPREILEKPGKLSSEEFAIIKQHTYYTKKILLQVKGLEDIANWAGNHHEKLNGTGYPEGLTVLSQEDQIIAFADIYTALTEDRPYRAGLSHEEAIKIIEKMVENNDLSQELFLKFQAIITEKVA
ncbi:HD-GYP domain-containing protein [Zhaonella formicivorans]|uniref:HD-GYP domain-containing protein n=1 Tax=Zhaonella formicivorans TaxID=2528593 RepID=UPI0010F18994|nr:HD domain-containing phosphohydrolase [Zhaonella formicivorans]